MRALPWVLLCASIGLNALLMMRARAAPGARAAVSPSPSLPPSAAPPGAPGIPRLFGRFTPPASEPASAPAPPTARPPAAVDDALIQDVWCSIAQQRAREDWRRDRESITRNLRSNLADREAQESNAAQTAAELAALADVPPARRDDFTRRYHDQRLARVAAASAALDAAPPDYSALLAAAEGLFSDEDALARELGGDAARDRVRAAWLEGRTTFIALFATLADAPDRAIRW